MKKILILSMLAAAFTLVAAELKQPVFRMSETDLLAVVRENGLNDQVTACQELAHKGAEASVPVLAALLADATPAALFTAARGALQNIPLPAAEAALKNALATVKDAKRRLGLETSLRIRARPVTPGYEGAAEVLTAFPPKNAVQNGDLAVLPGLVEKALGGGFEAQFAQRQLVGFPNEGVVDKMLELLKGEDVRKVKLALGVLGDRRVRTCLPAFYDLARTTKKDAVRNEVFKALGTLCDGADIPQLTALLKEMPQEERLVGALIRLYTREIVADDTTITVLKAVYGPEEQPSDNGRPPSVDVSDMITSLLKSGSRSIQASNRLAGHGGFAFDPAPGRVKYLSLTYRIGDGSPLTSVTRESEEAVCGGNVLPEAYAKPLLAETHAATGAAREAFLSILKALDKRARVPGADEELFRPIFNGKDLSGWTQEDGYFTVKDGVICGASTADHLCKPNHHLVYTAETLTDFELRGEFKLSRGANSGIQLRCLPQYVGDNGYQADMNGGGDYVGFIYHPRQGLIGERGADIVLAADGQKKVTRFADAKELQKLYKSEDWNKIRIKVEGRSITVWINDVKTTSVVDPREAFLPAKGFLALQLHQGPVMTVEFRNLRIR